MKRRIIAAITTILASLTMALAAPGVSLADSCSNAAIRAHQHAEALPDCRAYELVSPADKNGASLKRTLRLSSDGEGVAWMALGAFADAAGAFADIPYVSRRTATGWTTTAFQTRYDARSRPDLLTGNTGGFFFSADLSSMDFISPAALTPDDADNYPGFDAGATDVYRMEAGSAGRATWLSHGEGIAANTLAQAASVGLSEDGRSSFVTTTEPLTANVPSGSTSTQLYRVRGGHVVAVGTDAAGDILTGGSWLGGGLSWTYTGAGQAGIAADSAAISDDGSRFVYGGASSGGVAQVYLHQDGRPVRQLSLSQRSGSEGQPSGSAALFLTRTPDFGRVYLRSADQLTDDAPLGGGLYVYETATGVLSFSNPDGSDNLGPTMFGSDGLVQVASDGGHVYFVSPLDLAPGAVAGERNLYVRSAGQTRLIARLRADDDQVAISPRTDAQAFTPAYTRTGLSADGTKLVFESHAAIGGANNDGHAAIYLYDARANSTICVSCRPDGSASQGNALLRPEDNEALVLTPRVITDDGSTVLFSTWDALVSADTNSQPDVYTYRNGQVALISHGSSPDRSYHAGMSSDGRDLYFRSSSSLSPRDGDNGQFDVYDARRGGGDPESAQAPICDGEDCQGPVSTPPDPDAPGSSGFTGLADPQPEVRTQTRLRIGGTRRVRGTRTTLIIRVPGSGRLSVSGLGLRSVSTNPRKTGSVRVRVALGQGAKRLLKTSRQWRTTATVKFRTAGGASAAGTVSLTFLAGKGR